MRDPILHIRESDLRKILDSLLIVSPTGMDYAAMISWAAYENKMQMKDFYTIKVSNKKLQSKMARSAETSADNVELFNQIYVGIMLDNNFRNLPKILKGTKQYTVLQEVAGLADDFAASFMFENKRDAYKRFIEAGIQLMDKRKFAIEKMKHYVPKINNLVECVMVVEKDPMPEFSKQFFETWQAVGMSYSSVPLVLINPADYVHMVYGRMDAEKYGATYEDWIKAQFEQLAFLKTLPEISQMWGQNAAKNYQKYRANKGYTAQAEKEALSARTTYADTDNEFYIKRLKEKRKQSEDNNR